MSDSITTLGAAEIAAHIRRGELTPLEVVDAYIARIERVNPSINALVTPAFERAREEARIATERLAKGRAELPPLFGVPITIKDALPVAGVRFTAGSIHHRDRIASEDAPAVRRLREAGAIILGKTNCADMSGSTETHNLVFGLTRNPWNLERSAGGSTGGEGALIAAGGSPLGLGSDIAGSIRIPAAFNGICGLKPSAGRVSTEGHVPPAPEAISNWNTVGPLARRVEDLALALSVLSSTPVKDHGAVEASARRILIPDFISAMPVSQEVAGAVRDAAEALSRSGMRVVRAHLPLLRVAFEYSAILHREWLPEYSRCLGNGKPIHLIPEWIAGKMGRGQVASPTLALYFTLVASGPLLRAAGFGRWERLEALRREVLDQMGPGGLMLWPVFPTTAPKHGFAWEPRGAPIYTGVINSLGLPAVSVPVGLSRGRLPLAVQVIGSPGDDEAALAVAAQLERELGGYRIPPRSVSCGQGH
jgi:fatty acid amide hydrolase 2